MFVLLGSDSVRVYLQLGALDIRAQISKKRLLTKSRLQTNQEIIIQMRVDLQLAGLDRRLSIGIKFVVVSGNPIEIALREEKEKLIEPEGAVKGDGRHYKL
ncbi:hypothetical protein QVD17_38028 [Tagetes erecta]|uniref:Uncharacterized protein n=1 Tax=Tagetes erecta TaxID=13708 RepID=A0AAD8JXE7_TARER|nr:hypothetical protein QVD17_38028 [Tagetes erecta]